jgi:NAD-dependent deacetylase
VNRKKILVVLSGAGMRAESGIKTFRDSGGLWEEYDVSEVATPMAWWKNRDLVLRFYNERRRQLEKAEPNKGHLLLADLQHHFDVRVITQNVDDLHERSGSKNVLHLHGELTKARSTDNPELIYEIGYNDIKPGDKCEKGSQLRPHIVWFGEAVPLMDRAAETVAEAEIFVVIGTSLNVYPAAGLVDCKPDGIPVFLIDPNDVPVRKTENVEIIRKGASEGMQLLTDLLLKR